MGPQENGAMTGDKDMSLSIASPTSLVDERGKPEWVCFVDHTGWSIQRDREYEEASKTEDNCILVEGTASQELAEFITNILNSNEYCNKF